MLQKRTLNLKENQKSLLRIIYDSKEITRSDLVQKSGLSTLTVAKFVSEFLSVGILIERGTMESTGGRKPAVLCMNP